MKYNEIYLFIYVPLWELTGQTRWWIFAHDGSNDAESLKNVLFGVLLTLHPIFMGQITSQSPHFRGVNGHFKPTGKNLSSL